jgi:hypothetical protein
MTYEAVSQQTRKNVDYGIYIHFAIDYVFT